MLNNRRVANISRKKKKKIKRNSSEFKGRLERKSINSIIDIKLFCFREIRGVNNK